MSDRRAEEYRRMLRWYPAEWRRQNEDAVIGALLDEDDAARRSRPELANRLSLVAGGLRQRFIAPEPRSVANLVVLSAAAALSLFYFTITWAPGTRYDGSLGPFSNASVITCVLLLAALVVAAFGRGKTARLLAIVSVVVEIAVGALNQAFDWQGPGASTVVLFAGLGLVAATPPALSLSKKLGAGAIVLLLVTMLVFASFAVALFPELTPALAVAQLACALAGGAGILALAWRAPQQPHRDFPDEEGPATRRP